MAQYVRHFLEEPIQVGGLGTPAGLSSVYMEAGQTFAGCFSVVSNNQVVKYLGDRYCNFQIRQSQNHRCAFGMNVVNADAARADGQILIRVNPPLGGNDVPDCVSLGARCSGTDAAWTGYFGELRRINATTMTAAIVKGTAGADADLVSAVVNIGDASTYWMRFDFRGTALKFSAWTGEITDEPVAWTLTTADATIAAAGALCIGGKELNALAGHGGSLNLFFLSLGTGTDVAPVPPKTWAEYLAFLSLQDTLRCVLLEVDVLGQDAAGAAFPGRVAMSNYAFRTQPCDQYPHIPYESILLEAPKNRRKVSVPARDKMAMTYGDAIFKNEVVGEIFDTGGSVGNSTYFGRLDSWLTWNWDGRTYRALLGHPSWRRCDFKTHFLGVTQDIYRAGYGQLGLKTRGADGLLQRPLLASTFGGAGPNVAALIPFSNGQYFNIDFTSLLYDQASLAYQVAPPGANVFQQNQNHDVRDSGASLKKATRTITAVNTVTDTITFDAAHGLVVGAQVIFTGALPAPLLGYPANYVSYYVKTVPAADQMTLAATPGGATIDLTTATLGATMVGRLYQWSDATGRITLISNPAGRLSFDAFGSFVVTVSSMVAALYAGTKDAYHGQALSQQVGLWFNQQRTAGDAMNEVTASVSAAFCQTREGNYYLKQLDVPTGVAAWTIKGDLTNWRTGERFLPAEVERLGYQKNYTIQKDGLVGSVTPANRDLYGKAYSLAAYTPSETGLEQPANHLLRRTPTERVTTLSLQAETQTESQRLYNLYRKTCGTWLFDTGAWALAVEPMDEITVVHPRDGFDQGKNVIVIGIADDAMRGKVELEIFGQIDGQWPVIPPAWAPFVPGSYY